MLGISVSLNYVETNITNQSVNTDSGLIFNLRLIVILNIGFFIENIELLFWQTQVFIELWTVLIPWASHLSFQQIAMLIDARME